MIRYSNSTNAILSRPQDNMLINTTETARYFVIRLSSCSVFRLIFRISNRNRIPKKEKFIQVVYFSRFFQKPLNIRPALWYNKRNIARFSTPERLKILKNSIFDMSKMLMSHYLQPLLKKGKKSTHWLIIFCKG